MAPVCRGALGLFQAGEGEGVCSLCGCSHSHGPYAAAVPCTRRSACHAAVLHYRRPPALHNKPFPFPFPLPVFRRPHRQLCICRYLPPRSRQAHFVLDSASPAWWQLKRARDGDGDARGPVGDGGSWSSPWRRSRSRSTFAFVPILHLHLHLWTAIPQNLPTRPPPDLPLIPHRSPAVPFQAHSPRSSPLPRLCSPVRPCPCPFSSSSSSSLFGRHRALNFYKPSPSAPSVTSTVKPTFQLPQREN
mmetsp:Transcript_18687/g.30701  ORF Transcript_18687/g.30701 Transcript_18687/m.30701 type:complete len:246 (+) Transcript_18687:832-1569(+)